MYQNRLINSIKRHYSSIKFFENKKLAEETSYFKKEEQELLCKLLEKNPEIRFRYGSGSELDNASLAQDISLGMLILMQYYRNIT